MKKILNFIICLCLSSLIFWGCSCSPNTPTSIFAVWWWNDEFSSEKTTEYLNFAKQNNINEIYYCSSKFNENTAQYINQANSLGISVFWLDGNYKWLYNETEEEKLHNKIKNYINYNANNPENKFAGVHLDIEPHQSKNSLDPMPNELNFNTEIGREFLIGKLITLANKLKQTYPQISFTYDIPFWLDDAINYNNQTKPAYQHIIDIADGVVVMSYRDTAEKIYSVAKEEIEYATQKNKQITLSVECGNEENQVTFKEEGKTILKQELNKLKTLVPEKTGICIHHIKTWHDLKD